MFILIYSGNQCATHQESSRGQSQKEEACDPENGEGQEEGGSNFRED